MIDAIGQVDRLASRVTERFAAGKIVPLVDVRLAPPIPRPGKIICIGLNYADHAREIGIHAAPNPVVFREAIEQYRRPGPRRRGFVMKVTKSITKRNSWL